MFLEGSFNLKLGLKSDRQIAIALVSILVLSLGINICGIWWGLPSYSGWAADELIPLEVLKGIEKGFSNGWYYKYPPFHFYLLTLLYSPLLVLQHFHLVNLESLPTYTILFYIGRFLSIILGTFLLLIIYLCGLELYDKKSSLFAVLIAALSVPFIYYAKTINLEVPYLVWVMLSFLFYLRLLKYQNLKNYLWFSLTASIAVCTKDQAYAFYVLTTIFIIIQHYRHLRQQNPNATFLEAITDEKIMLSLAVGLGSFILVQNLIFNLGGFLKHVKLITAGGGSIRPRYEKSLWGQLQMLRQSLTHLRFSLGWPCYAIGLLGFVKVLFRSPKKYLFLALLVPLVSYYLFYICLVWYNNVRYLMPIALVLALLGGKFIGDFLNPTDKFFKAKSLVVTLLLIYTLAYGFSVNLLMLNDSRYYVEEWMQKNIDKNALIFNTAGEKYAPRLEGYRWTKTENPTLDILAQIAPDYIVVSSGYDIRRFEKNEPEYAFFDNLNKEVGYQLVLQHQSQPLWNLFDRQELAYRQGDRMYIYSNFDKINPEIKIYQRGS